MFCTFVRSLIVVALLVVASGRLSADDNTLTAEQKQQGWRSLFDGQSLEGWSIKSGFASYKVEDGSIRGTTAAGSPNTFLTSEETFADFELTFDVLLESDPLNSGVQIRSRLRDDGKYGGRVYGPQVEIEASPGQAGFIYGEAAGGWQSPEPESKDPSVNQHSHFKNGQWNAFRVRAVGRHIQTWINGQKIADLQYDPDRYEANPSGFIGLQVHGVGDQGPYQVRWKNIYVKPVDAAQAK